MFIKLHSTSVDEDNAPIHRSVARINTDTIEQYFGRDRIKDAPENPWLQTGIVFCGDEGIFWFDECPEYIDKLLDAK
jgi:hypothetical protein